ncbi:MAG: DUF2844 domain-containing protein [Candidatus Sulfotelmatobacter sp.]
MLKISYRLRRRLARRTCGLLALGALFAIVSTSLPAWAALGGDFASVQADQVHMQGSLRTTVATSYSVHEIQSPAGTVVREYVSSAGKVFAIAWQGQWPPDMRQLLGNYFEQYVQAAKAQSSARMGRRPLEIEQPGLVVQMGGHPRSFRGRAYVPELLPSGVAAEAIQ